ncbi:MAG: class I SAM-dependent methyltransferase, partial [Novosphingobium sp.]|nr:class I SAM-dependent methyltransferase [Novosphingobium sp.]
LDEAIAPDARVVEIGCGTGQMTLFLAGRERIVIGADLTRASLRLGAAAARRFGIDDVLFVETDLSRPGLRSGAFDVVYCSGVLHHTPTRLPTHVRQLVARASGGRWLPRDPVLADRSGEAERQEAWRRDQYCHPEEHSHTLGEVRGWLVDNGIEYVRSYPSSLLDRDGEDDALFTPQPDYWPTEALLAQVAWIARIGGEGGLFVVVGRRTGPSHHQYDGAQNHANL